MDTKQTLTAVGDKISKWRGTLADAAAYNDKMYDAVRPMLTEMRDMADVLRQDKAAVAGLEYGIVAGVFGLVVLAIFLSFSADLGKLAQHFQTALGG